ncbi:MAG: hypothetical protein KBE09_03325 [Candidatus Pacebacteria bacterium]|nr:hypothetical protein [Candidatus Paceibacterota bacterium]
MKVLYFFLALITLMVAALLGAYIFFGEQAFFSFVRTGMRSPKALFVPEKSAYENLVKENPDFASGMRKLNAGEYASAQADLANALEKSTDDIERLQIAYKIAIAKRESGDRLAAIRDLKDLVAHPDSTIYMKAYAVENMGQLYYTYPAEADELTKAIFSGAPYSAFLVAGDLRQSYANLFEYATSFYPTGYAEMRVAEYKLALWDAAEKRNTITDTVRTGYRDLVVQKLRNADADIERIKNIPNTKDGVAEIMMRRAMVIGKLQKLDPTAVVEFGSLDTAFQSAFTVYALKSRPAADGFLRFNYAYMLWHNFGTERASDIRTVLAPLYQNPAYGSEKVTAYFKTEKKNVLSTKSILVALADIDPDFKAHLLSLGWQESDF